MTTRRTTWTVIILLALSGPLTPVTSPLAAQEAPRWTPEQQEIVDLTQRVVRANNAGDVEAWVGLFADDFVYMPPGVPAVETRPDLIEVARAGFRHDADIDITPVEIVVRGDWAWSRNRVTGTVTVRPEGRVVQVDSKEIVIYRRAGPHGWRIARLIVNNNS